MFVIDDDDDVPKPMCRGGTSDLNVYIIRPASGTLGWSTFPWEVAKLGTAFDGVVVHIATLPGGTMAPYNRGYTLVHEVYRMTFISSPTTAATITTTIATTTIALSNIPSICIYLAAAQIGHWLGLLHVFENGCDGLGDSVNDTPPQASAAYGCPLQRHTCPGPWRDPVTNYMGYTDDSCMTGFTRGQAERILAMWQVYRSGRSTTSSSSGLVEWQPLQQAAATSLQPPLTRPPEQPVLASEMVQLPAIPQMPVSEPPLAFVQATPPPTLPAAPPSQLQLEPTTITTMMPDSDSSQQQQQQNEGRNGGPLGGLLPSLFRGWGGRGTVDRGEGVSRDDDSNGASDSAALQPQMAYIAMQPESSKVVDPAAVFAAQQAAIAKALLGGTAPAPTMPSTAMLASLVGQQYTANNMPSSLSTVRPSPIVVFNLPGSASSTAAATAAVDVPRYIQARPSAVSDMALSKNNEVQLQAALLSAMGSSLSDKNEVPGAGIAPVTADYSPAAGHIGTFALMLSSASRPKLARRTAL